MRFLKSTSLLFTAIAFRQFVSAAIPYSSNCAYAVLTEPAGYAGALSLTGACTHDNSTMTWSAYQNMVAAWSVYDPALQFPFLSSTSLIPATASIPSTGSSTPATIVPRVDQRDAVTTTATAAWASSTPGEAFRSTILDLNTCIGYNTAQNELVPEKGVGFYQSCGQCEIKDSYLQCICDIGGGSLSVKLIDLSTALIVNVLDDATLAKNGGAAASFLIGC